MAEASFHWSTTPSEPLTQHRDLALGIERQVKGPTRTGAAPPVMYPLLGTLPGLEFELGHGGGGVSSILLSREGTHLEIRQTIE